MMGPVRYHEGRFPPDHLDWPALIPLLGPTAAAVARYDGVLAAVPNPTLLLSPLTTQEAVLSSRIEGTQTTMGEVLEFESYWWNCPFRSAWFVRRIVSSFPGCVAGMLLLASIGEFRTGLVRQAALWTRPPSYP